MLLSRMTRRWFSSSVSGDRLYGERRLLGFQREQIYSVVSDVDSYYTFVPWCKRSLVKERGPDFLRAKLVIGFPPLVGEAYTSHVHLFRPHLVTAVCTEMKLFKHLKTVWKFSEPSSGTCEAIGGRGHRACCLVDFAVHFQFKSDTHSYVSKYENLS